MKKLVILFTVVLCITICNAQNEVEIRKKINDKFALNIKECTPQITAISDFNKKKEFWSICKLINKNRIIKIHSHKKDTYYEEIYFEEKGKLIYAIESELYVPPNQYIQQIWSCQFYIENNNIVSLMSLGHGKTEDDKWNPDEIIAMYKKRLLELKKIKK